MASEALFTQGGTYDAAELRKLIKGIWYSASPGGVIEGLAVTVGGALSISVGAGYAKVDDETSGAYLGYSTSTSSVSVSSNSGGGATRNDTIYARVLDPGSGGTAGEMAFDIATGTSTIPALSIPLASVAVTTANALTVTTGARIAAEPMNTAARGAAASLAARLTGIDSLLAATAAASVTLTGSQVLTNKNLTSGTNTFPTGVVLPPGMIVPYAGPTAPSSWLMCAGQVVSRTTYAALFAIIGVTYGVGDGSTTFAVPDLRGRTVAGPDTVVGIGAANRLPNMSSPGLVRGVASFQMTEAQLASHTHGIAVGNDTPDHAHTTPAHAHGGATTGHTADHSHHFNVRAVDNTDWGGDNGWRVTNVQEVTPSSSGGLYGANTGGASNDHAHYIHAEAPTTHGATARHQHPATIYNAGSSAPLENVQPTMAINYIIKT